MTDDLLIPEEPQSTGQTQTGMSVPPSADTDKNVCATDQAGTPVPLDYATPTTVPPGGHRAFVGHAKLISLLTLLSRILGMAREAIAAHFFGAGVVWSAFTVAFTIPNLFRKLFGEGALSAAFIPLYAHSVKHESPKAASDFAAASVNMLVAILLAVTLLGEAGLWGSVAIWNRPPHPMRPDRLLMLKFTAIMLPYVVLICGTAFLGAILQVHKRFGLPAAAPVILNVMHIVVIGVGAKFLHLSGKANPANPQVYQLQEKLAYWLALFVLVAGVFQVWMLVPALRQVGFRFRWVSHFWTGAVKRMLKLSVPVAMGAGVLQLSVLLDKGISFLLTEGISQTGQKITEFHLLGMTIPYPMEAGAPARLGWAQFLYQFPLGVFAIALATAIFPRLSTDALDPDRTRFRQSMRNGIEMTLLEGLPASIGLIIVRYPAIRLLFQHGQFDWHATDLVAYSVVFYSIAIWAFSLQQILNRAYYALHDMKTPLILSVVTLLVNLAVELPLIWTPLREAGMAAGTAASFTLQALVMVWLLNRRAGGLGLRQLVPNTVKMLLATGLMWAACWVVQQLPFYPRGTGRVASAIQLFALMAIGGGVYFGACLAMGVGMVRQLLPRRFRRA